METLLSSDFWSDQIAAVFKAWAILVPLILALWAAFKTKLAKTKKEMRGLRAYTEAVEFSIAVGPRPKCRRGQRYCRNSG